MPQPEPAVDRTSSRSRLAARTVIIAISLKMYFDPIQTLRWSARVAELARTHPAITSGWVTLVVFPSLPVLGPVIEAFARTPVAVGAQDLFWEDRGPYTGATSGADLRQLGCEYVEIGHVERRRIFGEDDRVVNLKVAAALRNGLTPLVCIGEEAEGPDDEAAAACIAQLESATAGAQTPEGHIPLVVAYEPAWAIGGQKPAGSVHVAAVTTILRAWIEGRPSLAGSSLIYGGSAGTGLLPDLDGSADGLFLGRFAHDPAALRSTLDETWQLR